MATEAHTDAVRSYYEHVDDEAYDDLVALFADDIEYRRPGHDPIVGIEAFEAFYHEVRDLEEGTHELDDVVAEGDRVAVRGRFRGHQGGTPIDIGFADFFAFDANGLVRARHTFTDQGTV